MAHICNVALPQNKWRAVRKGLRAISEESKRVLAGQLGRAVKQW